MTRCLLISAALACLTIPAVAQEAEEDRGLTLMERGAQMFMEGIMREMEPALDDLQDLTQKMEPALRDFVQEMGPALAEILGDIKDLSAYHPPEMLPNGDIILRRKTPDEMAEEPLEDEIEI